MFNLPEGVGRHLDDDRMVCTVCGELTELDDGEYLGGGFANYGEFICKDCLKENYVRCDACNEWTKKYEVVSVSTVKLCEDCYAEMEA